MAGKKTKKKIKSNEHVYKSGEDLGQIAIELTGHRYLMYRLLIVSGLNIDTIKDGDVLRWE